jgi:hypothetical protein
MLTSHKNDRMNIGIMFQDPSQAAKSTAENRRVIRLSSTLGGVLLVKIATYELFMSSLWLTYYSPPYKSGYSSFSGSAKADTCEPDLPLRSDQLQPHFVLTNYNPGVLPCRSWEVTIVVEAERFWPRIKYSHQLPNRMQGGAKEGFIMTDNADDDGEAGGKGL